MKIEKEPEQKSDVFVGRKENALEQASLSKSERRKVQNNEEKAKWAALSGSEKVTYFFQYYAKTVIILALVLVALVFSAVSVYRATRPKALRLAVINYTEVHNNHLPDFEEAYREYYDIPEKISFALYTDFFLSETRPSETPSHAGNVGASDSQLLESLIRNDQIDAVITDREGLEYLGKCELNPEVFTILDSKNISDYRDFYATVADQDGYDYVLAIDISSSDKLSLLDIPYTEAYLIFGSEKDTNTDKALELLEFLMK